jgi:polyferredoxin
VSNQAAPASNKPPKPLPVRRAPTILAPAKSFSYHKLRKWIQLVCVIIFVALPFFNVVRFDIPRQRFYFAGYELWINEFAIIFFALMFGMFLIAAAAILYGRVYCSYLCPQMIFSEMATGIENRIRRAVNKRLIKWPIKRRNLLVQSLFYLALGVVSVFLAFVFIAYFVEPRDLVWRLMAFDLQTAGGIAGATTTLLTFLDFTLVRQRFCTTVCPYGYIQGILGDDNTLIVQYRDAAHECIECKKCVRVCEMGIDIRRSPYQIECIHCGDCIDACEEVLARLGKKTLIHYAWGERGEVLEDRRTVWYRRLGLRDAKRVVILLLLLVYASALFVALAMRHAVLVRVAPVRTTMYRVGDDGKVYNQFRMTIANRSSRAAQVTLTAEDLPGAVITLAENPIALAPGETLEQQFEIAVSPADTAPGVNHFRLVSRASPDETSDQFDMTFITPTEKKPK